MCIVSTNNVSFCVLMTIRLAEATKSASPKPPGGTSASTSSTPTNVNCYLNLLLCIMFIIVQSCITLLRCRITLLNPLSKGGRAVAKILITPAM